MIAAGIVVVAAGNALFNHKPALESFLGRRRQRNTTVIGLRRAAGNQGIGALCERIGDEKFQFARFVSTGKEAEQVIALDEYLRPAECLGQVRQEFNRRGIGCVTAARET